MRVRYKTLDVGYQTGNLSESKRFFRRRATFWLLWLLCSDSLCFSAPMKRRDRRTRPIQRTRKKVVRAGSKVISSFTGSAGISLHHDGHCCKWLGVDDHDTQHPVDKVYIMYMYSLYMTVA